MNEVFIMVGDFQKERIELFQSSVFDVVLDMFELYLNVKEVTNLRIYVFENGKVSAVFF